MEENFEKKSSKKIAIIISIIVVVLIAVAVAGVLYLNYTRKPEKIFSKAIEEVFEPLKEDANTRKAKMEIEATLAIKSNDSDMIMANEMFKSMKIKSITEVDVDKKIFNENIQATYAGEEIINADGLIQDNKLYFYLNEIYSKYIEIPEEYFEGEDLSSIFEIDTETSPEECVNDMKQILLDEVNSRELTKENVELNGENVQKSTLRLTQKEALEITVKLLEEINEYQPTVELEETIKDLKAEIEYLEENENYMDISIYTKGLTNEFVKAEFVLVDVEYEEVIVMEFVRETENEIKINFLLNEYSTEIDETEKIIEVTVNTEEDNKGTVKLKFNEDEDNSVTLKLKYKINYDVEINKRDTSNSISIDDLTEEDFNEMNENIEKNPILYSILGQFMVTDEEYYEDDYYYYDEYEGNFNYNYVY